jgi:nucleotide-binding universal stress UspA family protein
MGSVAEKIFRQAACPVLTVGPNVPSKTTSETQFPRILFATDFSEESLAGLPYAMSTAEEDQSHIALLHAVGADILDLEAVRRSGMRRLRELVLAETEPWCSVEPLVEFAGQLASPSPAGRIVEIAKDRAADLIVRGVRATRGAFSTVTHQSHTTPNI